MDNILFLKPIFKEKIWGGEKLAKAFNYEIPSQNTGEAWLISGLSDSNIITSGTYEGQTLSQVYKEHPELFKHAKGKIFPILIKIIDANNDLSVQVHPDNKYAKKNEGGQLGKCECWYVLDSDEDAKIVLGHRANNKQELIEMTNEHKWQELLKQKSIRHGDFIMINPGTIHALKSGVMVYEVQQASDITYRLYDYDRLENGKPRELHLKKALDVIKTPFKYHEQAHIKEVINKSTKINLGKSKYFKVFYLNCKEELLLFNPNFLMATVINGEGTIEDKLIKKGDSFIVTSKLKKVAIAGNLEVIITHL